MDATKFPFHWDGFGINAADGERLAKVNLEKHHWDVHTHHPIPNPDFEYLGRLFSSAPQLVELLKDLANFKTGEGYDTPEVDNLIKFIETGEK